MRALRCGCGRRLEAEDDGELLGRVLAHMRTKHPEVSLGEERVRGFVSHAYEFEYAEIYAGAGVDEEEEFGPEPY
jgi:hypothetical protein